MEMNKLTERNEEKYKKPQQYIMEIGLKHRKENIYIRE